MERLQKVIAASGITSRRKAEDLIVNGKVKVNGQIVKELGTKVSANDSILVNDILISKEQKEYYLLNKPRGVVSSTHDDKGRVSVVDLINTKARIYPVGRLDYDTTGLLILTNDGDFANILMHPKSEIDKVYVAKLEGIISIEAINLLKTGVMVDGNLLKASRVKLKKVNKEANTSFVSITIHEGKNHQVKNMFEAVGYHVEKLKREKEGFFELGNLGSGEYRKLTKEEIVKVLNMK